MLNETSVRSSEGLLIIPVLEYLGIGASQGKNPNKGLGYTEFLYHSVKLHLLHQMKPCSRVTTN